MRMRSRADIDPIVISQSNQRNAPFPLQEITYGDASKTLNSDDTRSHSTESSQPASGIKISRGRIVKMERKGGRMTLMLSGLLLLLATSVLAQQPGQPPMNSPPQGTPPTFPKRAADTRTDAT